MQSRDFRDFIERVKLRSPIEAVVQDRVPALERHGASWKACCPFHQENTPSFVVSPERGTWHCFGACAEGGDVIAFVQRFDGLSFLDALRLLAQMCGEPFPERFRDSGGGDARSEALYDVLERAKRLYARTLFQPEGTAALAYARGRGLSDETLKKFGVGFAPSTGNPLLEAAQRASISEAVLTDAGLVRRAGERVYDFFHGRLLIPIANALGRTVGFGGRKLSDDEPGPKYVNTAETALFKKSRLIYGLDLARAEIRRTKRLILMEGYTDVMAAHQVGVGNAAAVLGTATTEDHAALVRRTGARRITLVFDGDEAGAHAGLRALEHLLPLGLELDVVVLPEGADPCDLCISKPDEFRALLDGARDWYAHALDLLRGLSGTRLAEEVDGLLGLVERLQRPVERDLRIAEMARFLKLPEEGIRAQARARGARRAAPNAQRAPGAAAPAQPARPARPAPVPTADPRVEIAFRGLIGAALLDNSLIPSLRRVASSCPPGALAEVLSAVLELDREADDEAPIDAALVLNALGAGPGRDLVVPLVEAARSAESLEALARDQVAWLDRRARERDVRARLQSLPDQPSLDDPATREALRELHRELRGIKVPRAPEITTPPVAT